MILARTREQQLLALAKFYRRNHETASAEAIEWALAELAQRDQMLSEAIDRQVKLENDLAWWHLQSELLRRSPSEALKTAEDFARYFLDLDKSLQRLRAA